MFCRYCGTNIPDGMANCPGCGALQDGLMYCMHCGQIINRNCVICPICGRQVAEVRAEQPPNVIINSSNTNVQSNGNMKAWKLVSGILSIILCPFVMFQSCAAGVSNTLEQNGEVGGSAGVIVAIMLLASGIVAIATRNSNKNGGNLALAILCGIGALLGFTLAGSYGDLIIWAAWCLICAALAIIAIAKGMKSE